MAYRIALVTDGLEAPDAVHGLAQWASQHSLIALSAILTVGSSLPRELAFPGVAAGRGSTLGELARWLLFNAIVRLECRILRNSSEAALFHVQDIRDYSSVYIHSRPVGVTSDLLQQLSPEEAAKLRELNLDALLWCASSLPDSDFAEFARDGVVFLQQDEDYIPNNGPPAFNNVLNGKPDTGFAIRQLKRGDGAARLLYRGSIATQLFYTRNLLSLRARAIPYLQRSIENLARRNVRTELSNSPQQSRNNCPKFRDSLVYLLRTSGRVLQKAWTRIRWRKRAWGVAYAFRPWRDIDLSTGKILFGPPNTYIADPFAFRLRDDHFIFLEEFSYSTRRGVIAAYRVTDRSAERIGVVLEEPHHLSFPFVFRQGEKIYMVPESEADRSIKLYECSSFPEQWSLAKVLMSDISAVDTLVFERDSRWYMVTTIQGCGPAKNNAELCVFYANDPLDTWTAHPLNPVVMDASRGRNGGLLRDTDGNIYRVAQRSGFTTYGVGSAIYRIDEISPVSYHETLVREIRPDFFENLIGTHHIHEEGGLTVYDFCRNVRPSKAG